ncbi:MAG: aminotransferase, partial [Halofilum sp. (in: g-proteobacteria)]
PEIYREAAFAGTDFAPAERLPVARRLGETSLMLPVHPTLDADDMASFAEAVEQVMVRAAL